MKTLILPLTLMLLIASVPALAQRKKLDLEDIAIKGELLGDDRLNLLSRQENELKNYVKFRTNYREEMVEELPEPKPGVSSKVH